MSAPRRIRVLHVIESMHVGGAQSLVLEHLRHAGPGFEASVCALNRGGPAFDAAGGPDRRAFLLEKGRAHPLLGRLDAVRRLAAWMRSESVDVVNGHNPVGALYSAAAARLAGVPVLVRTEHSLHYAGRHSPVYPALEAALGGMAQRVICVCDAVRESHRGRLRWASDRFVTIANGISTAPACRPRAEVRAELGIGGDEPLVLAVGSLTPHKAQHVLIDAFQRLRTTVPAARLVLVGEGPLRGALEARAREHGLGDRLRFLGARTDVPDLMNAADAFALSSVREGLSITLLESMRAARPAVATCVGGTPETMVDGETGRLVPMNDPVAMAESLAALLGDADVRERMGRCAHERWAERFTAERMVRETEQLYLEVLAITGRAIAAAPIAGGSGGGS